MATQEQRDVINELAEEYESVRVHELEGSENIVVTGGSFADEENFEPEMAPRLVYPEGTGDVAYRVETRWSERGGLWHVVGPCGVVEDSQTTVEDQAAEQADELNAEAR